MSNNFTVSINGEWEIFIRLCKIKDHKCYWILDHKIIVSTVEKQVRFKRCMDAHPKRRDRHHGA